VFLKGTASASLTAATPVDVDECAANAATPTHRRGDAAAGTAFHSTREAQTLTIGLGLLVSAAWNMYRHAVHHRGRNITSVNTEVGPDMILMDEPFGALDAQTRMVMQSDLQTLSMEAGATARSKVRAQNRRSSL
jgi:hypothetical protein